MGVSYRAFAHQFILTAACAAHMGVFTVPVRGNNNTQQLNAGRHVPLQLFSLCSVKKLQGKNTTRSTLNTVISQTLTSRRTAVGYGRGARVRTLVPSRILPRASAVNPNSYSQEDLTGEVRNIEGRKLAARLGGDHR